MPQSYFDNHRNSSRFPWSLYHAPIREAVSHFVSELEPAARVLNVGCGLFHELPHLRGDLRYAGADIDPRAIEYCRDQHAGLGAEFHLMDALRLPFADRTFDAVYATEVIEHCAEPEKWFRELLRVARHDARILLTTPNYASRTLRFLESTALEVVARAQGFSRKDIHPFRCTGPRLAALVRAQGAVRVRTDEIAFGWVVRLEAAAPSRAQKGFFHHGH